MSHDHKTKMIFMTLFYSFLKIYTPQQVIRSGKLSIIIIFKLCKFNVNLLTLCFLSFQKYIDPYKKSVKTIFVVTIHTNIPNLPLKKKRNCDLPVFKCSVLDLTVFQTEMIHWKIGFFYIFWWNKCFWILEIRNSFPHWKQ